MASSGHAALLRLGLCLRPRSRFGRAGVLVVKRVPGLVAVLVVAALGIGSCAEVQERLDLLRVRRIELIDDKEQTKLDVEIELRSLRERVTKLEADLAAVKATPAPVAPAPMTSSSATPDAGATPTADAGVKSPVMPKPPKRSPFGGSGTSPGTPRDSPDVF